MNWKNRLTNYNFWISMFSAILLVLQALKIKFDIAYVNEIFTAVLGLLVVIGIISDPTRTSVKSADTKPETKQDKIDPKENNSENVNLPIIEKNETDDVDIKNDFKTILDGVLVNLEEKINEIENLNIQTLNSLKQNIEKTNRFADDNRTEIVEEKFKNENSIFEIKQEEVQPAVAENENPYIDVINQ